MPLARRSPRFFAGLAVTAVTTVLLTPVAALADPPPGCTAADLANVTAGVAASTSGYLFAHPDVNAFYSGLRDRPDSEVPEAIRGYFADNPQAHADLLGIRQPLVEFRSRCELPEADHGLLGQ